MAKIQDIPKTPTVKIQEIKSALEKALEHSRAITNTGLAADRVNASEIVEKLQRDLSALITEGAKPCPYCDRLPVGIEQPLTKGRVEYEIGCRSCDEFEHADGNGGTVWKSSVNRETHTGARRALRVRGGMISKHAVEAWNEMVLSKTLQ